MRGRMTAEPGLAVAVVSGHRIDRVAAWGLVVGALLVAGLQLDHEFAGILWGLGVVLLFAGILIPRFRDRWFGTAGD